VKLITWTGRLQIKDSAGNEVRLATVEDIIAWIKEHEAWDAIREQSPISF